MTLPDPFHARQRFIVGISGGKDSDAALLWMVHESGIPRDQIVPVFCDTENEHPWTYDHIEMLAKRVHPVKRLAARKGFYDLALEKSGFPAATMRFCTEVLKIEPTRDFIQEIRGQVMEPITVSGVRAEESDDRAEKPEWDYSGDFLCKSWRPLIRWTYADVVAIHERHGVPLNPLYALGLKRVGCLPCMLCVKEEVRITAQNFPERIDMIEDWERRVTLETGRTATFFRPNVCPVRFHDATRVNDDGSTITVATIRAVVRWSLTGERARGSWDDQPKREPISCKSGHCE